MFIDKIDTTSDHFGKSTLCARKHVVATIITDKLEFFVGTNACLSPQKICPRKKMKSGEGYYMCKEICRQTAHAEVNALRKAGEKSKGSILILTGHTYCCDDCITQMLEAGIKQVIIV